MPTLKHDIEVTNPKTKVKSTVTLQGYTIFFRVALCHITLGIYFDTLFQMSQLHNWSISELENMLPWERDIYVDKLIEHIKEENEKIKEQNRKNQYG